MEYGSKEFNQILKGFKDSRNWMNDITLDIEEGENELDPLTLLRFYEEEASLENSVSLASQMILNKRVVFKRKDKVLLDFVYTGGDLGAKFSRAPYLLDILLKLCYGILVKKLTPPSEN